MAEGEAEEEQPPVRHCKNEGIFMENLINAEENLVVVHFCAEWCYPCKKLAPQYMELAQDSSLPNVMYLEVDVDENANVAEKYDIEAMPTFVFIRDKDTLEKFSGADVDKVRYTVKKHLGLNEEED
eukprot:TRINITY_DN263_c1_g1_i1.p1 TRINITY_DN263_c1_g1~~TRINITY_DN263_c1_g1_i1.p1  ORF type:complete len:126 (-),score=39.13 TRINITY_DN263_c1_g1_i1:74-451(-)